MRRIKFLLAIVCIVFSDVKSYSQIDSIGSGGAISFNGINDYIDFGDVYSDLKLPFTVSAWVYLDPTNNQPGPVFTNRNCDPVYTGFRLIVNNNVISMDYGDGLGGNNPAFRRGKNANVGLLTGNWNHVTAVVKSGSDIELYLNGINVGGEYTGGSSLTMDSSKPGFASTGYFISNGTIYRFKGKIDEIRLWNRALSVSEIRNTMCVTLKGNETGLIGYWTFNETNGITVFDRSPNHHNGTFVGSPTRLRSGAAIGDISVNLYSPNLTGSTISLEMADESVIVNNMSGSCQGVQVYSVGSSPSQTAGLGTNATSGPYFGVFIAQQNPSSTFDVRADENKPVCAWFARSDNSSTTWNSRNVPIVSQAQRIEVIQTLTSSPSEFELGDDVSVCDNGQYEIATGLDDQQYSFLWNTSSTTSSIQVTSSGIYTVTVSGPCFVAKDSINVQFLDTPSPFELGDDIHACEFTRTNFVLPNDPSYTFEWQDGSTNNTYEANDFGIYWAVIKNACGASSDTIEISRSQQINTIIPNVVTANADGKNDVLIVQDELVGSVSIEVYNRWGEQVFESASYQNNWDGEGLSTGTYFLILRGPCINPLKSEVHLIR